jgi:hypothetical protein
VVAGVGLEEAIMTRGARLGLAITIVLGTGCPERALPEDPSPQSGTQTGYRTGTGSTIGTQTRTGTGTRTTTATGTHTFTATTTGSGTRTGTSTATGTSPVPTFTIACALAPSACHSAPACTCEELSIAGTTSACAPAPGNCTFQNPSIWGAGFGCCGEQCQLGYDGNPGPCTLCDEGATCTLNVRATDESGIICNQSQCTIDTHVTGDSQITCANGSACQIAATTTTDSWITCDSSSACDISATTTAGSRITCANGADCTIQFQTGEDEAIDCRTAASCDITGTVASGCTILCGAACRVHPKGSVGATHNCTIECPDGPPVSCPDGSVACGGSC